MSGKMSARSRTPEAAGLSDIGGRGTSGDASANGGVGVSGAGGGIQAWEAKIKGSIARSRDVRGSNYVQIATVDNDGRPRNRTVVFRGFQSIESTAQSAMRMITDARSEKVGHVERSPACEMVWWFAKSSEQYRIAGDLQLIGPQHDGELQLARTQQWEKLTDSAREQFFWQAPGIKYTSEPKVPKGGRDDSGKVLPPPEAFLLMLLWPNTVKYLRLTDNFSQLDTAISDGAWKSERVNP